MILPELDGCYTTMPPGLLTRIETAVKGRCFEHRNMPSFCVADSDAVVLQELAGHK